VQRPQVDQLLPGMFQRAAGPGTVVAAALDVMAELHEVDEAILADIDATFDPYRAPDRFVPFLARWVDLDRLLPPDTSGGDHIPFAPGYGCLRNLVATGAELAQWRGTSAGLRWFLRLATGIDGFTIVEDVPGRPFHIEVHVPPDATPYLELVERIVAMDKPAFVTAAVVAATPVPDGPVTDDPGPTDVAGGSDAGAPTGTPTGPTDPSDPTTDATGAAAATASGPPPGTGPEATPEPGPPAEPAPTTSPTELVDAPTVPIPTVRPVPATALPPPPPDPTAIGAAPGDGSRWSGSGTESASLPLTAPPPEDPPSAPEGAAP
jgi:phage tail-like protein